MRSGKYCSHLESAVEQVLRDAARIAQTLSKTRTNLLLLIVEPCLGSWIFCAPAGAVHGLSLDFALSFIRLILCIYILLLPLF